MIDNGVRSGTRTLVKKSFEATKKMGSAALKAFMGEEPEKNGTRAWIDSLESSKNGFQLFPKGQKFEGPGAYDRFNDQAKANFAPDASTKA